MSGLDTLVWIYSCGMLGSMLGSAIHRAPKSLEELEKELYDALFWPVRAWRRFTSYQEKQVEQALKNTHQHLLSELSRHLSAVNFYSQKCRELEQLNEVLLDKCRKTESREVANFMTQEDKMGSVNDEQIAQRTDAGISAGKH